MLIVTNLTCPARSEQNEKARLYGVKMANLIDKTKASGKFHSWSTTNKKVHSWSPGNSLVLTTFSGRAKQGNDCIYHRPKPC